MRGKEAGKGGEKMLVGPFVGTPVCPVFTKTDFSRGPHGMTTLTNSPGGGWRLGWGQEEGKDFIYRFFLAPISDCFRFTPKPMPWVIVSLEILGQVIQPLLAAVGNQGLCFLILGLGAGALEPSVLGSEQEAVPTPIPNHPHPSWCLGCWGNGGQGSPLFT